MKQSLKIGCSHAALLAGVLACAGAEARVYEGGTTPDEMKRLLAEAGLSAVTQELDSPAPDKVPDLIVTSGKTRWHVQFMACTDGRCADVRVYAGYDLEEPDTEVAAFSMTTIMINQLSGNLYIDDEGDPILQADINTDGASANNIEYSMKVFDTLVRCTSDLIDFDKDPDACGKLTDRLAAAANIGLSMDDIGKVVIAPDLDDAARILRESGFEPFPLTEDTKVIGLGVAKDDVIWTVQNYRSSPEQPNAFLLFAVDCKPCAAGDYMDPDTYNEKKRWLTARPNEDSIMATLTLPIAGGVTESSIGMMMRSFHSMAKLFESDMRK